MNPAVDLTKYYMALDSTSPIRANGKVTKVVGLVTESHGSASRLGALCDIHPKGGMPSVRAEVIGFRDNTVLLMPLGDIRGVGPGSLVIAKRQMASVSVGKGLLGRVIDGLGNPIDGKGPVLPDVEYPLYTTPMSPLARKRISSHFDTVIRAISGLLTVGYGQRMGILPDREFVKAFCSG